MYVKPFIVKTKTKSISTFVWVKSLWMWPPVKPLRHYVFLVLFFINVLKPFLTRRTAFCFYMLKEKFCYVGKKSFAAEDLSKTTFFSHFPKHISFWWKNALVFQSLIGWFIPRRKGYPFSEKQFNLSTYRCTIQFIP